MSDYIGNLALMALGLSSSIRPRVPSLFEPINHHSHTSDSIDSAVGTRVSDDQPYDGSKKLFSETNDHMTSVSSRHPEPRKDESPAFSQRETTSARVHSFKDEETNRLAIMSQDVSLNSRDDEPREKTAKYLNPDSKGAINLQIVDHSASQFPDNSAPISSENIYSAPLRADGKQSDDSIIISQKDQTQKQKDSPFKNNAAFDRSIHNSKPIKENALIKGEMTSNPPTIKVTIDRIEVKAISIPEKKAVHPPTKVQSLSLDDYLLSLKR
jgi:hypothetical protein